jgi:hypothetical protein
MGLYDSAVGYFHGKIKNTPLNAALKGDCNHLIFSL